MPRNPGLERGPLLTRGVVLPGQQPLPHRQPEKGVGWPSLTTGVVSHLGMPLRKGKSFPSEGEEGHGGLAVKGMIRTAALPKS